MTVRDLHERAVSLRVLEAQHRYDAQTLGLREKELEERLARLKKAVEAGVRFRYELGEFNVVAMDVALLRDRLGMLDELIAEVSSKVGGDGA